MLSGTPRYCARYCGRARLSRFARQTVLWGQIVAVFCVACHGGFEPSSTGARTLWRAEGKGFGLPAFDGSQVYFSGWKHELIAVDKMTGAIRWTQVAPALFDVTRGRSVIVAANVVVMGDYDVYGFDVRTGERRWTFRPSEGFAPGVFDLATDCTTIYAGSPASRVYALDAVSGTAKWTVSVATDSTAQAYSPVFDRGFVYVCLKHETIPTTGGVVALDAGTGAIRWSTVFPAPQPYGESGCAFKVAVANDVAVGTSWDGHVYAMDRLTGELRWSVSQLPGALSDLRPVAAHGNIIVVGSLSGIVVALDATSGNELWRATPNLGSTFFGLTIDESAVYSNQSDRILSLDLATGNVNWVAGNENRDGEFFYVPAPDGDRLYAGGEHGLYALRK